LFLFSSLLFVFFFFPFFFLFNFFSSLWQAGSPHVFPSYHTDHLSLLLSCFSSSISFLVFPFLLRPCPQRPPTRHISGLLPFYLRQPSPPVDVLSFNSIIKTRDHQRLIHQVSTKNSRLLSCAGGLVEVGRRLT
jgi:hypothetical protein